MNSVKHILKQMKDTNDPKYNEMLTNIHYKYTYRVAGHFVWETDKEPLRNLPIDIVSKQIYKYLGRLNQIDLCDIYESLLPYTTR